MGGVRNFAIIGLGPRGGYALECFIVELAKQNCLTNIHISLFESTKNFGNGQVYDLVQNQSNWINITERILTLPGRPAINSETIKIDSFPSYHNWIDNDYEKLSPDAMDTYPPRSKVGEYLSERFQSLTRPLIKSKIATLHKMEVNVVTLLENNKIQISTADKVFNDYDEILLTIGHQITEKSQQIRDWEEYSKDNVNVSLFEHPYPTKNYLDHITLHSSSTIGIRGFGLAMIDVVRAIVNQFGYFEILDDRTQLTSYRLETDMSITLVPFSLDGLPPAPKPLNATVDRWFEPTDDAISKFEEQIDNVKVQAAADGPDFLIDAFAPIAADIYLKLANKIDSKHLSKESLINIIKCWLKDQSTDNTLCVPQNQPALKTMKMFVEMASGTGSISLDYCIGQVWRHCQPTIYKALSFSECSNKVIAELIDLDESTKRYSYGPPVSSIQQLIALEEVGILNLSMVKDPDIHLLKQGWQLKNATNSITASIMIDSVLDSPKFKAVLSPIVRRLLIDERIQTVHDDLGVETDDYGYLTSRIKDSKIPIALLGRLAKGTIIGVDAILECFGARPRQWAERASRKHKYYLESTV